MDKRIGAQLYTLRDFCQTKAGFEESMKKLQEIGYKQIQVSGIGPIPAEDLRGICDRYGIVVTCTHRAMDNYENDLDGEIAFHKALGCDIAGLGAMPGEFREHGLTKAGIMEFIQRMNKINAGLQSAGITFAYHNHAFEFEKIDGKFAMDYIIEYGEFSFIVDTYWLAYAGLNPAEYIQKLGNRAVCVHFKDLAIINDQIVMAEVTEGNLDWDAIVRACGEAGVQWALVEQDVCRRDPFESMTISYNALAEKGFH